MKRLLFLVCLTLLPLIVACSSKTQATVNTSESDKPYGNPHLLVDVAWVNEHLDDPRIILVDLRSIEAYEAGHISNAVQLDLPLLRATVDDVRGQTADAETVGLVLGERGIDINKTLVAYDAVDSLDAARFFWTMEYYGHTDVRLLNGGWEAWQNSGYEISTTPVTTQALAPQELTANETRIVTVDWVAENLENDAVQLIDARSEAEFKGEDVRALRGGHIPSAFNQDWRLNLDEDGFFKPQSALEAMYQPVNLEDKAFLVAYCQTGHRASVAYFTLRLMGYENVAVYDGSWEEWGNRSDLPIATQ